MKLLIIRYDDDRYEIGIDDKPPVKATMTKSGEVKGASVDYEWAEFEVETGKDGDQC